MQEIRIGVAQFEAIDGGKDENFQAIEMLAEAAVAEDAELVCFHECSIPGYTFLENLSRDEIAELAEAVPNGPSVRRLMKLAKLLDCALGAGLVEIDDGRLFNTYVVVTPEGFAAKHRKIHAFVSEHIDCGDSYTVFDWFGCRFGILICYDCNLVENPRMTAMMGAEIILAPARDGVLAVADARPGAWLPRKSGRTARPTLCPVAKSSTDRRGRGWLMRWLPARAYENGVYLVYTNPIGEDGGHDQAGRGR